MKESICSFLGIIGGVISAAFGGWEASLTTLVIFMLIDYLTGIIVAGVFHKSTKTSTGSLESITGFKGLVRKGIQLLIVLIACRLDLLIGRSTFIRDAVVIAFITNETISVTENAGLMGIPMPEAIKKAIEVLKTKEQEETQNVYNKNSDGRVGDQ